VASTAKGKILYFSGSGKGKKGLAALLKKDLPKSERSLKDAATPSMTSACAIIFFNSLIERAERRKERLCRRRESWRYPVNTPIGVFTLA
jgi:hypothetical protein